VPQSRQNPLQPAQELPNPELNPLLNPTLGNNLGRWAQVYFTSPPEKREEAVLELLHELEAEAGSNGVVRSDPTADPAWLHSLEGAHLNPALTCAECGHRNAPQQRFCGMCGSRLVFSDPPIDSEPSNNFGHVNQTEEASPHPGSPSAPIPSFGTISLFATAPTGRESDTSGSEVQWLQEKSFDSGLAGDSERSSATKYLVTALGLMLLGVLFYAQWKPQTSHPAAANPASANAHSAAANHQSQNQPSGAPAPGSAAQPASQPPATAEAVPQGSAPQNGTAPQSAVQVTTRETARNDQNPPATNAPAPAPPAAKTEPAPVRNASPLESDAPDSPSGAGEAELAEAEGYLTGKYGSRNSSEAARYLWKAVSKENPTAILLLSDLYLAGDGVPKSCDQARLLLRAAARKNVAAAAHKLRELQQTGCP
jgi:hypothetical protein